MVDLGSYLSDNVGKVVFFFGAVFLIIGVFTSNQFGTILSAVTLFLGVVMVFVGLFHQLGLFSGNIRSLSVMGMILICIAIAFLTFSLVAWAFLDIVGTKLGTVIFKGWIAGYEILFETDRPYVWLADLFMKLGLGILVFGIGMKIASMYRP